MISRRPMDAFDRTFGNSSSGGEWRLRIGSLGGGGSGETWLRPQSASMTAGSSSPTTTSTYRTGDRYLHPKTGQPLTLRYIGTLPPSSSEARVWYGVEYDDPSKGKGHSGTFEGAHVFRTRQIGAGAFIKAGAAHVFESGKTFAQAIEERYSSLDQTAGPSTSSEAADNVLLGSSNAAIVVEIPNIEQVQKRVGRLERLREMGLEGEWVSGIGGDEETRRVMRERLIRM